MSSFFFCLPSLNCRTPFVFYKLVNWTIYAQLSSFFIVARIELSLRQGITRISTISHRNLSKTPMGE